MEKINITDEQQIKKYLKLLGEAISKNELNCDVEKEIIRFINSKINKEKYKNITALSLYFVMFIGLFIQKYQLLVIGRIILNPKKTIATEICSITNHSIQKQVYHAFLIELKKIKKYDYHNKIVSLQYLLNGFLNLEYAPNIKEEKPSVFRILNSGVCTVCNTEKSNVAQTEIKVYQENILEKFSKQYHQLSKEQKGVHQQNLQNAIQKKVSDNDLEKKLFIFYLSLLKGFEKTASLAPEYLNLTFRTNYVSYMQEKIDITVKNKEQLIYLKQLAHKIPQVESTENEYMDILYQSYRKYLDYNMLQKIYLQNQKNILLEYNVASNIWLLQREKREILRNQKTELDTLIHTLQQYTKK